MARKGHRLTKAAAAEREGKKNRVSHPAYRKNNTKSNYTLQAEPPFFLGWRTGGFVVLLGVFLSVCLIFVWLVGFVLFSRKDHSLEIN